MPDPTSRPTPVHRSWLKASLLVLGLLGACSAQGPKSAPRRPVPPQAQNGPTETSATAAPRPSAPPELLPRPGRYSAQRVNGDYGGYPELEAFIARMVNQHDMSPDYLAQLFSQARRKQWTLDYLAREAPASATPRPGAWTRYRAQFLTEAHIAGGAAFWHRHAAGLERAARRYGVAPEYIVGILGVETTYGRNMGSHRVLDALTTLAFDYPRRAEYFKTELEDFLVMSGSEGIEPTRPLGSYAGAMGLGQFMPSSFLRWAVDFDGDGTRDLWQPEDAIGSVANYFADHGWVRGGPVVTSTVIHGAGHRDLETGYDSQYSLRELVAEGIQPSSPIREDGPVRLLRLRAASGDQYWLGHTNFYVITRYNHSTHYAMAVHELAQAVKRRYLGEG